MIQKHDLYTESIVSHTLIRLRGCFENPEFKLARAWVDPEAGTGGQYPPPP